MFNHLVFLCTYVEWPLKILIVFFLNVTLKWFVLVKSLYVISDHRLLPFIAWEVDLQSYCTFSDTTFVIIPSGVSIFAHHPTSAMHPHALSLQITVALLSSHISVSGMLITDQLECPSPVSLQPQQGLHDIDPNTCPWPFMSSFSFLPYSRPVKIITMQYSVNSLSPQSLYLTYLTKPWPHPFMWLHSCIWTWQKKAQRHVGGFT